MYTLLTIILFGLAFYFMYSGIRRRVKSRAIWGVVIGLGSFLFFWMMEFWGDILWFQNLGYADRFWTEILAKTAFFLIGAILGGLILLGLVRPFQTHSKARYGLPLLGFVISGIWAFNNWDTILLFWNKTATGTVDPILNMDNGFYLFTLPFLDTLYSLLTLLIVILCVGSFIAIFNTVREGHITFNGQPDVSNRAINGLYLAVFLLILILAVGKFLSRYHLMYSTWGAVAGPGWTDVNVRLPGYWISIILALLLALTLYIPSVRTFFEKKRNQLNLKINSALFQSSTTLAILFISWFIILTVVPGLFQWLRVEPNEITFEKEYIRNNIDLTRKAFRLNEIEEREFPVKGQFDQNLIDDNQGLLDNVRLWDWRALDAVYKQFQEIRLYYEFVDVDIDRYHFDDRYRQVMISAREMKPENLPEQSQTFVNKRFKYTHGYGITLNTVSDFTPQGLPNLLIKDIPLKHKYPALKVQVPQIYYGELTHSYVVVNSKEKEFDYPRGEENEYVQYDGQGGVQLSNIWRKFLFGYKFDGTRFFLSEYPTAKSRIIFYRQIKERVKKLAPFIHFDDDPYITLVDGKLFWVIDGYTTSTYYPYSEPFNSLEQIEYKQGNTTQVINNRVTPHLDGINYIRNSVKTVIDAYNGNVEFYVYEDEPLITVWQNIFPDFFKPKSDMPHEMKNHIRYPVDMLLLQGLVYAKYHMTDPTVFYNQEDLWIRATEKYYNQIVPVQPYYVMWEKPGTDDLEFTLILPFTPKNRQVLIGWIAGMCDPNNYGRFLSYKFPKDKRVLGTQQVETKIDQDRFLSGQLTLWDQRGSNVIRGNVLAIPIEETLLYVEPIYLQAETAAYPELRLVVLMHNDILSYAETFDKALQGLLKEQITALPQAETLLEEKNINELIQQANQAFQQYLNSLSQKDYQGSARSLEKLENTLNELSQKGQGLK